MYYKNVDELAPGDRVAHTIRHWKSGVVLLTPNFSIDARTLPLVKESLKKAGHNAVLIQNPALTVLLQYFETEREEAKRNLYQVLANRCTTTDKGVFSRSSIEDFTLAVRKLCEALRNSRMPTAFMQGYAGGADALAVWREKSAERTYLAIALGIDVRSQALEEVNASIRDIGGSTLLELDYEDLGLGAMFIDAQETFGEEEVQVLMEELEFRAVTRGIIRQRNQRFDGYGRGSDLPGSRTETVLRGKAINAYARIAQIAACYSNLHVGNPDPKVKGKRVGARTPIRALWEMQFMPEIKGALDPDFLLAFRHLVQPFPMGHRVTLDTLEAGVVIAFDREHPCRPLVRILERQGAPVPEPYDIALSQRPDINVWHFEEGLEDCRTFLYG